MGDPRTLILLRHSKADWPDVPDHERPLAARGRRDARIAARWFDAHDYDPDLVLCSTAVRTRETCELVDLEASVRYEERIYLAAFTGLVELIQETPPDVRVLALIGHNPGMHQLAANLPVGPPALLKRVKVSFPTSAIAVLSVPGEWAELEPGAAELLDVEVPRA